MGRSVSTLKPPRRVQLTADRRARIVEAAQSLGIRPAGANDEMSFLRVWTQLEAIAKARGDGIMAVLAAIGGIGPPTARVASGDKIAPEKSQVAMLDVPAPYVSGIVFRAGAVLGHLREFPHDADAISALVSK